MFAVLVTGPPGAGKTACVTALADALVVDEIAHAAIDADEVAWAYPFPAREQRTVLLAAAWEAHRTAGHELLLVAEVIESNAHLADLLDAVGADQHLLVRLEARPATLRDRIVAREPPGWFGLEHLLGEVAQYATAAPALDDVQLTLDSERLRPHELAVQIRAERPDKLGG